jgi:hypothetical protein
VGLSRLQGAIREWIAEVKRSGPACFDKFITTLEENMEIITNYFTRRLTVPGQGRC